METLQNVNLGLMPSTEVALILSECIEPVADIEDGVRAADAVVTAAVAQGGVAGRTPFGESAVDADWIGVCGDDVAGS